MLRRTGRTMGLVALMVAYAVPAGAQQDVRVGAGPSDGSDVTSRAADAAPTQGGQDAFAALTEIVAILEADPATDWSRVDVEALRRHLIEMHEVTLQAGVESTEIPGGSEFLVTGEGRTVASIREMANAHSHQVGGDAPFGFEVETVEGGVRIRTTARDPDDVRTVEQIRGLGFIGLMTLGAHHGPHHLAIARGDAVAGHTHSSGSDGSAAGSNTGGAASGGHQH